MGVPPQGEAADCNSVAATHVGFDSLHSHHIQRPYRLRWLDHRPFKAENRDRHPVGIPTTMLLPADPVAGLRSLLTNVQLIPGAPIKRYSEGRHLL